MDSAKIHRIVVIYLQHNRVRKWSMLTAIRQTGFARDELTPIVYYDNRVTVVGHGSSDVVEKLKLIRGVISVISVVE